MIRPIPCAAAFFLVVLGGCASNGSSRFANNENKFEIDQEYVNAVNTLSRQNGVRVTWVNPPTKRAGAKEDIDG